MGKIQLTEGQYERLKKNLIRNVLNEQDLLTLFGGPIGPAISAAKALYDYTKTSNSDNDLNPYAPLSYKNSFYYQVPSNSWKNLLNYLQGLYPGQVEIGTKQGSEYYRVGQKGVHTVSFWENLNANDAGNTSSIMVRVKDVPKGFGWCPNGTKPPSSFSNDTQVGPAIGGGKCVDLGSILPQPPSQKSNLTPAAFNTLLAKLKKVDSSFTIEQSQVYKTKEGTGILKIANSNGSFAFYQDLKTTNNVFVFAEVNGDKTKYTVPSDGAPYNGEELSDYYVKGPDNKFTTIAQIVGASKATPSGAKPVSGGASPKPKPKPVQKINYADYGL